MGIALRFPSNNLSNFSNGIFISNQSLDIITKTGNYRGANISELKSYITPSSWCGIKAYVQSDNAAFFHIVTSDNIVICAYRDGDGTYKIYPLALKSDLDSALVYRGVITGDLNRGRNLTIAPGIYSIQGTSSIINGPSDFGGWGIFVQFPDNLFSQMILNSPNYIKFRKYSGSDPSWSAW